MKDVIVGLKELRENMNTYIAQVKKGKSFIVVRKSKPVFKLVPSDFEDVWEVAADFVKIDKQGIPATSILKELKRLNA